MTNFRHLFTFQQKEIDAAFLSASRHASALGLRLLFSPNPDLEHGKLLIIVPGSSGNANKRNLIKRQIKSIFYENKLYSKPGTWILKVYKQAIDISFDDLQAFMVKHMQ